MKSVTEFWNVTLFKGLEAKKNLLSQGKTPEEIQASLGETFKLEGDKLKYFSNAVDVAEQNAEKLQRVLVVSLNEGENTPAKATKIEEHVYVPEFVKEKVAPVAEDKNAKGGRGARSGGGKGKGGPRGPRPSPWGMSPEEKEAKKAAARKSAQEASAAKKS